MFQSDVEHSGKRMVTRVRAARFSVRILAVTKRRTGRPESTFTRNGPAIEEVPDLGGLFGQPAVLQVVLRFRAVNFMELL